MLSSLILDLVAALLSWALFLRSSSSSSSELGTALAQAVKKRYGLDEGVTRAVDVLQQEVSVHNSIGRSTRRNVFLLLCS